MTFSVFIKNFVRKETTLRALKVAFVVAPILIVINHFDAIISGNFSSYFYPKCLLTFFVPYTGSAFSFPLAYSQRDVS